MAGVGSMIRAIGSRRELVEAFTAGVRGIPVLVGDAEMPAQSDLPADPAPLARRQSRQLRHRYAAADLARLIADLAALDPDLGAAAPGTPPASGGFISYRRGESSHVAGRISDRLVEQLGKRSVFMDVDSIEPGLD